LRVNKGLFSVFSVFSNSKAKSGTGAFCGLSLLRCGLGVHGLMSQPLKTCSRGNLGKN